MSDLVHPWKIMSTQDADPVRLVKSEPFDIVDEVEPTHRCLSVKRWDHLRLILQRLSTIGNEDWKTPGHPMNAWVQKDTVNALARDALRLIDCPGGGE